MCLVLSFVIQSGYFCLYFTTGFWFVVISSMYCDHRGIMGVKDLTSIVV